MASGSGSSGGGGGPRVLLLFVHTSLDTHLVVAAPPDRTVAALRSAVAGEHLLCFPKLGPVVVEGFQTTRRGVEFRLSDSLLLSDVVKRGDGEGEGPCLVRALAAAAPPDRTPDGGVGVGVRVGMIHDPASKVTQATGAVSADATPEKNERPRLSEDLSSPTTNTVLEIVAPEKKKKRFKGLSSNFKAEIQPPIKCKPQGEDQNQVIQEDDLKIVEKPGDKSTNSPEEGTMKKKKKGKEGTSNIATKDGAVAEKGSKLSDPASKVTQATGAVSADATPEKNKRRRLSEDLSSPTTATVSEIVAPEKKRRRSKRLSSDCQAEIQLPIKCKPQGEDQNQVIRGEDLKIVEKPGDKSTNNPEEGTIKKKKKGKEGTSKIATKDGAIAEGDSKLSGSCDYNNSGPCKQLVMPGRKKLLVLDINGLLADIIKPDDLHRHNADFKISGKLGFKRPFCDDFLKFCFENFEVGVWSSRMWHNLNAAVNHIFGGMRKKLLFCWDQSKCTTTTFETLDNRTLFLKDLNKLWGKVESGLPWMGQFTPTNTLLIDDTPCKASLNPPYTAIFPYPYKFSNYEDNALGPGGYIRVYLEKIAAAKDVPKFLKKNPFGLATMETHPEWKHYVTIRDALKGA